MLHVTNKSPFVRWPTKWSRVLDSKAPMYTWRPEFLRRWTLLWGSLLSDRYFEFLKEKMVIYIIQNFSYAIISLFRKQYMAFSSRNQTEWFRWNGKIRLGISLTKTMNDIKTILPLFYMFAYKIIYINIIK